MNIKCLKTKIPNREERTYRFKSVFTYAIVFAFLHLLLLNFCLFAQTPAPFERVWGSEFAAERATSVLQIADGSIYVSGYTDMGSEGGQDMSLCKFDANGNLLWTRYYGTANNDVCNSMALTNDGQLLLVGATYIAENVIRAIIVKTDTDGNIILQKQPTSGAILEWLKAIEPTPDGGSIAIGSHTQPIGEPTNNFWLLKLDQNLNTIWSRTFGGMGNDIGNSVVPTTDGGYILAGDSQSFGGGLANVDIYVVKTNQNGSLSWDFIAGDEWANGVQKIMQTPNGNYLLVGETVIDSTGKFDIFIAQLDNTPQQVWRNDWGYQGTDAGFSVIETPDQHLLIAGYSNSNTPEVNLPIDILLLETDQNANELGVKYFAHPSIDIAYDVSPSVFDGYLLAGLSTENNGQYYLAYTYAPTFVVANPQTTLQTTNALYPNPVARQHPATIRIRLEQPASVTLSFCDANGKLLCQQQSGVLHQAIHHLPIPQQAVQEKGMVFYTAYAGAKEIVKGAFVVE